MKKKQVKQKQKNKPTTWLATFTPNSTKKTKHLLLASTFLFIGALLVLSHFFASSTGYATGNVNVIGGTVYNVSLDFQIPVLSWAGIRGNLTDALNLSKNTTGGIVYDVDLQKSEDCTGIATIMATRASQLSIYNLSKGNNTYVDEMLNLSIDYPESAFNTFTQNIDVTISNMSFTNTLTTYTFNSQGAAIYPTYVLQDNASNELVFTTQANLTKGVSIAPYQLLVPSNTSNVYNFFITYTCQPDVPPIPSPVPGGGGGGGSSENSTQNTTPQVTIQINNTPNLPNELPLNLTDEQAKIAIDLQIERAEKYLALAKNQSIDVSAEIELIEQTKWLKANKLYFEAYRNASRAVLQLEQKLNAQRPTNPLLLGIILIIIALIIFYLNRSKAFIAQTQIRQTIIDLAAENKVEIEIVEIELKHKRVLVVIAHSNNPFALKDLENAMLNTNQAVTIDVRYARSIIENHETMQKENMQELEK